MATIASLNVVLSAGVAQFSRGIKSAQTTLSGFVRSVFSVRGAIESLAAALTVGAAAYGLKRLVGDAMESIDATAKLADRLGSAVEPLIGLQHAAEMSGVSAEDLARSLEFLNRVLGESASGQARAAQDALARLGLSASALAQQGAVAAVAQIADALRQVASPADRAAIATDLFGKSAQQLLLFLSLGSSGLAEMQAEADRLGLSFSRIDAAQVEAANDALTRVSLIFRGIGTQLAVQLAPFIEAAASKLVAFAVAGAGVGGRVVAAFEAVVRAIAAVADFLELPRAAFKLFQAVGVGAVGMVARAIALLLRGISALINLLPGVSVDLANFMDQMASGLLQDSGELFAASGEAVTNFWDEAASKRVERFFASIRADAAAAAQASIEATQAISGMGEAMSQASVDAQHLVDKLRTQIATFGMSAAAAEIYELKQKGASDAILAQAEALARELEAMEQQRQAMEDGKRLREEMMNPLEQFAARIEEIATLLERGAIDEETFGRAAERAMQDLQDAIDREMGSEAAPGLARLEQSRFLTGVSAAGREKAGVDSLATKLDRQNKLAEEAKLLTAQILSVINSRLPDVEISGGLI